MAFDTERLQKQIPSYLTANDQQVLLNELKAIAGGGVANYILNDRCDSFKDSMMQGDGWSGFQLFIFETGERRSVRGVILSNSCDVDPNNARDAPARVVFAPLVKLSIYEKLLIENGIDMQKVKDKISAIKAQKTSNIFYLPASGSLKEDWIVRLDEAQSMPISAHEENVDREKHFTLSLTGFYMFVFKLSVHFCRLQENIIRKPTVI